MKLTAVWPAPNDGALRVERKLGLEGVFMLKRFHCEDMFFSQLPQMTNFLEIAKIEVSMSRCVRSACECMLPWWQKSCDETV